MPTLYKQLKKLPWAAIPAISSVSKDHGRRARRTIKAALAPAWIGFDGAAQVAQLRRTVTKNGKKTVEVVYLITSDRDAGPATLAAWVRSHWKIENCLHWVRDVTYLEDKSLVRTGNAPRVMASLPGHQSPAPGRPGQHSSGEPPPPPRPAAHAKAASGCMNATLPCPCGMTWRRRCVLRSAGCVIRWPDLNTGRGRFGLCRGMTLAAIVGPVMRAVPVCGHGRTAGKVTALWAGCNFLFSGGTSSG